MITLSALAFPIAAAAVTVGGALVAGTIGIGATLYQRRLQKHSMYGYQPSHDYYNGSYYSYSR